MPANDASLRLDMAVGSIATALASAETIYDLWTALFYDGGTAGLTPFAVTVCVGVACAAFGLYHRSRLITGFDLLLATLAPVGFAWISSVASLLVSAALLFCEILRRHKRGR